MEYYIVIARDGQYSYKRKLVKYSYARHKVVTLTNCEISSAETKISILFCLLHVRVFCKTPYTLIRKTDKTIFYIISYSEDLIINALLQDFFPFKDVLHR